MHEHLPSPIEHHGHGTHNVPARACELDARRFLAWVLNVDHEDAPIREGLATRDFQDARSITTSAARFLR